MLAWYTLSARDEPYQPKQARSYRNGPVAVIRERSIAARTPGNPVFPSRILRTAEAWIMVHIRQLPLPCVKRNSTERYDSNAQIRA